MTGLELSVGKLDFAAITAAAVALADAEGLEAVSMRRVGAALGVSAMALYRHVSDRDALLVGMAARVSIEPKAEPSDDAAQTRGHLPVWRQALEQLALATWNAFEAHPWLHSIVVSPTRLLDLTSTKHVEEVLSELILAGLSPRAAHDAVIGVSTIPIGIAAVALPIGPAHSAPRAIQDVAQERRSLRTARGEYDEMGKRGGNTGKHSTTQEDAALAAVLSARPIDPARGRNLLEFVLQRFLDGLEARTTSATPKTNVTKK